MHVVDFAHVTLPFLIRQHFRWRLLCVLDFNLSRIFAFNLQRHCFQEDDVRKKSSSFLNRSRHEYLCWQNHVFMTIIIPDMIMRAFKIVLQSEIYVIKFLLPRRSNNWVLSGGAKIFEIIEKRISLCKGRVQAFKLLNKNLKILKPTTKNNVRFRRYSWNRRNDYE